MPSRSQVAPEVVGAAWQGNDCLLGRNDLVSKGFWRLQVWVQEIRASDIATSCPIATKVKVPLGLLGVSDFRCWGISIVCPERVPKRNSLLQIRFPGSLFLDALLFVKI